MTVPGIRLLGVRGHRGNGGQPSSGCGSPRFHPAGRKNGSLEDKAFADERQKSGPTTAVKAMHPPAKDSSLKVTSGNC